MHKEVLHPKGVANPQEMRGRDPAGYPWSQAVKVRGDTLLFIAGQSSVNKDGLVAWKGDMLKQTEQCLTNLRSILEEAGGNLSNVTSTIWFVTSAQDFYKSGASTLRWKFFEKDFPTSTLVEVKGLANPELMVEVQAYAVL